MHLAITSKTEAKEQNAKHYYTGKPCKHGHLSVRLVSTGKCSQCAKIYHDVYIKRWQVENKTRVNEATTRWRINHHERATEVHKRYYYANKDHKLQYNRDWRQSNSDVVASHNATRRAAKTKATTSWMDTSAIQKLYTESQHLSITTGVLHHVDHIIPLIHPLVCGLHCEQKLASYTSIRKFIKR